MELKPSSKKDARGQPRRVAGRGNLPTVLHVDDDPNDSELFKAACDAAAVHFHLRLVDDGDSALRYLKGEGEYADREVFPLPSLVILDLKMPRVHGLELLKWIKAQSGLGSIRVMILSGSELKDDIRQATMGGADAYLVKPLRFEALVKAVQSISAHVQ